MCDPQGKNSFLAFPEAKKGVVHSARLRRKKSLLEKKLSEKKFIV